MSAIKDAVQFILDLGASVMLPIILTIFGLLLGQGFNKSFRAGLTVGVGFVGINLVIGLLSNSLGPAAQAFVKSLGLNLDILDVGWPIGAAISFGTPVAPLLIPIILMLNIVLVAINFTKTVDVDIWNYWHFIFSGSIAYYATNNMLFGILVGCITAVIIFKLADWTAPVLEHHFGLPGVSLPHTETVNFAPIMYALEKIESRIPGLNKIQASPEDISRRFGLFGEPLMMGVILGIVMGILGKYDLKGILTLGIQMGSVLVLLPRMVSLLMEGLIPLSEGAREFISKRFPGKEVYIGLDAAIVTGHPAGMAVALMMVPITILMSIILPYNRMLPFADLAVLPFIVIWPVAVSRGNIVKGLINSIISMAIVFFIATDLAELATTMGRAVGFEFPEGANMISGIDLGAHVVPWIIIRILQPTNPRTFIGAIVCAALYALLWWWVRNDIKKQYAKEMNAE